ncbi:MAG: GtrA family protein [archaeon]|nr:GtrA family protein [archaeon]
MTESLKDGFYQFLKFCLIGSLGALVNYSIFFVLYKFFGVYYLFSSAIGFIISVLLAFSLNSKFTFKIKKDKSKSKLVGYVLVNLFTLILGLICLRLFVETFEINIYLSNLLAIGFQVVSNFTGSKFLVFRK